MGWVVESTCDPIASSGHVPSALPSTLDKAQPDAERLELLSKALRPQDIQLYYQIVLKGRQDLPLSPTARVGIEMVFCVCWYRPAEQVSATAISTESTRPAQAVLRSSPGQSVAQPVSRASANGSSETASSGSCGFTAQVQQQGLNKLLFSSLCNSNNINNRTRHNI
ncbi:hypothetical protein O9992_03565 [Vibrio lentus]|nr:hypothetical protein [Vibrio lentus]